MVDKDAADKLEKKLAKIIKKMRRIQKTIAATGEPVSGSDIEQLSQLGRKYQKVVQQLSDSGMDKQV